MLKYRFFSCAAIVAVTVISAIPFLKNSDRADNSLPVWYSSSDPAYASYQEYLKKFGDDRFIVLAFETPGVFTPENLNWLQALSDHLSQVAGIERVMSLVTVPMVTGTKDEVRISPLYAGYPKNAAGLAAFRQKVLAASELKGLLLSADERVAGLVLRVSSEATSEASEKLVARVESVIAANNPYHYVYHLTGAPVGDYAFNKRVNRDYRLFFPVILLLNVVLLFVFFRDTRTAWLPSLLQGIALVWVLGLHFAMGYATNVVTAMLGPILVTVCVANAVHLITEYREGCAQGLNREDVLVHAVERLWRPSLYTALTTVAGFVSFGTSSIPPVNLLGYLTGFGVMVALGLNLFFLPVVLMVLPAPRAKGPVGEPHNPHIESMVRRMALVSIQKPVLVSGIFLALLLLAVIGIARIRTESNFFDYFFKHERVRQDMEFIESHLTGMGSLIVEIKSSDPDHPAALDPAVHAALEKVADSLLRDERTRQVRRSWPWLVAINYALHSQEDSFGPPADSKTLAGVWVMAESSPELARLTTPDKSSLILEVRTRWLPSAEMEEYLRLVHSTLDRELASVKVRSSVTGYGPLWVRLDRAIFRSQLASMAFALVVVALLMMVFSGGIELGLVGLIPNVLPIVLTFGFMGFAGIHLNVATVMIAGVSLGITVDDTIHYLARFRIHLKEAGGDYDRALEMTTCGIGTGIALAAFIMAGGFSVLCLGSFLPTIYFGSMVSLALILGIVCELMLTPLLVMKLRPF